MCSPIAGPPSEQTPKVRSRIFQKKNTETGKRNPGQVHSSCTLQMNATHTTRIARIAIGSLF